MSRRHWGRAVFLDRDGIINELVYHRDQGIVDSPSSPAQFRLVKGVGGSLKNLKRLGYKLILISNQPGIAKGHFTLKLFRKTTLKMEDELRKAGVSLDAQYYCLHHPAAIVRKYRVRCRCRKPKPGLILRAAREHGVDLRRSVFVGDGLTDVKAGKLAGCLTILISGVNSLMVRMMRDMDAEPDYTVRTLAEAVSVVRRLERKGK